MKHQILIGFLALAVATLACSVSLTNPTPTAVPTDTPVPPTPTEIVPTQIPPTPVPPSPEVPTVNPCTDPFTMLFLLRSSQINKEYGDLINDAADNTKNGVYNIPAYTKDLGLIKVLITKQQALEVPPSLKVYQDHHLKSMIAFESLLTAGIKNDKVSVVINYQIAKTEEDLALVEIQNLQKICPKEPSPGSTS